MYCWPLPGCSSSHLVTSPIPTPVGNWLKVTAPGLTVAPGDNGVISHVTLDNGKLRGFAFVPLCSEMPWLLSLFRRLQLGWLMNNRNWSFIVLEVELLTLGCQHDCIRTHFQWILTSGCVLTWWKGLVNFLRIVS